MAESKSRRGLGKGLGALLQKTEINLEDRVESVIEIDLNDITPMRDQPRTHFDEEKLQELAASIKENGVIQPIIVTSHAPNDYTIVAGERRWRAARMAKLKKIPAIVRDLEEHERMRQALIENIQRENLNAMEAAAAYQRLIDEQSLTQEDLSKLIGKSRTAIANTLRLNKLPEEIADYVKNNEITEGHARALLALETAEEMLQAADQVIVKSLNVRQTEQLVRNLLTAVSETPPKVDRKEEKQRQLSIKEVEDRISKSVGTKVRLRDKEGKGEIRIPYKDLSELDRLIDLLTSIK